MRSAVVVSAVLAAKAGAIPSDSGQASRAAASKVRRIGGSPVDRPMVTGTSVGPALPMVMPRHPDGACENPPPPARGLAMDMTLYYAPGAASLLVHWLLIELEVPHRLQLVDTAAKAQKSPEYLAMNPNGVVPTLVIDGAVVEGRPAGRGQRGDGRAARGGGALPALRRSRSPGGRRGDGSPLGEGRP